jgi:hypothetical protein
MKRAAFRLLFHHALDHFDRFAVRVLAFEGAFDVLLGQEKHV